jgi:hypothetical protein
MTHQVIKKKFRFLRRYYFNFKTFLICLHNTHFTFTTISFFIHTKIGLSTFINIAAQVFKPLFIIFISNHPYR